MKTIDILSVTTISIKSPRAAKQFGEFQVLVKRKREDLHRLASDDGTPEEVYSRAYEEYKTFCKKVQTFLNSNGKHYITV